MYLLSCKVCELQYVGQTSDKFRFRWNNNITSQKKAVNGFECPQWSFHQHFLGQGHNGLLNDCDITLIDKSDPFSPTQRENFWITTLGTVAPSGLNVNTEVRLF